MSSSGLQPIPFNTAASPPAGSDVQDHQHHQHISSFSSPSSVFLSQLSPSEPTADIEILQLHTARLLERQAIRRAHQFEHLKTLDKLTMQVEGVVRIIKQHEQQQAENVEYLSPVFPQETTHLLRQTAPSMMQQQQQQSRARTALAPRQQNVLMNHQNQNHQQNQEQHPEKPISFAPSSKNEENFGSRTATAKVHDSSTAANNNAFFASLPASDLLQQMFHLYHNTRNFSQQHQQQRKNKPAAEQQNESMQLLVSQTISRVSANDLAQWEEFFHSEQHNNHSAVKSMPCPVFLLMSHFLHAVSDPGRASSTFRLIHEGFCCADKFFCLPPDKVRAARTAIKALPGWAYDEIVSSGIGSSVIAELVEHLNSQVV